MFENILLATHAWMDPKNVDIFFLGEEYKIFIMREWGAAANSLKSVLERKLMPFVTLRLKFNKFLTFNNHLSHFYYILDA